MADRNVAVVVGVGPGLGASVARRFAREGFPLASMARGADKLGPVEAEITASGGRAQSFTCDATDAKSVAAAFGRVKEALGAPEVLVYNAGAFQMGGLLEITPEQLDQCFRANCA